MPEILSAPIDNFTVPTEKTGFQTVAFFAEKTPRPRSVTRERVHARTRELALIAGRTPPHVAQVDYEQAKREVTGESDIERQEAVLNQCLIPVARLANDAEETANER